MAKNTFTKRDGSVYACDCCGRQTRHTGAQSVGSKLCAQCYELAGIENEISDGYTTLDEARGKIDGLFAEIEAKGGKPRENFVDLLAPVAVEPVAEPTPTAALVPMQTAIVAVSNGLWCVVFKRGEDVVRVDTFATFDDAGRALKSWVRQ
jgi:hypothetical protein